MFNVRSNQDNTNSFCFEISFYPNQNNQDQENKGQQMLVKMDREERCSHCWWDCKLVHALWESVRRGFPESKI